jgi:tetratricopeptide (TPR) repeat protein
MLKTNRLALVLIVAVFMVAVFLVPGCKKTQPEGASPSAPSSQEQAVSGNAPAAQPAIPPEALQHVKQGMELMKSHDYNGALKEFSAAIGKYPDYDAAYNDRAGAYVRLNMLDKAKDDLDKAMKINPHSSMTYYNYASVYALQNKPDLALDSLDKALVMGFSDYDFLRSDPDLNNIRNLPGYKKILEAHKVYTPKN